ncbi:putative baseplate assembly protein [Nodosilinea sp. LEGE 07088]|uniref:putative baseplate assembly protein n=1 Tax=Nodosilinea sp. LEGE 07088 TaxID=2777968 RepID=UPI0018821EF6|nr:putative baseplate assembly protein [Nodosilinea sp. LEGE 07088]
MTREFNFLPNLPKANLDDRTFDDLVQECMLRIPRYCPEWTNHNPGDPGITLIELFAWMTDQMLMRFNQVPRRNYVAFLELLGIRLQPPSAAQVELSFYLSKAQTQPIVISTYTEVATVRTETEPAVVFTTDRDLVIGQPQIRGLFTAARTSDVGIDDQSFIEEVRVNEGVPQLERLGDGDGLRLFADRDVGNCFYLVLSPARPLTEVGTDISGEWPQTETSDPMEQPEDAIAGNVVALNFCGRIAETTGIDPTNPPLRWTVWDGEGWQATILRQIEDDKTRGFSFHGQRGANPTSSDQGEGDVTLHLPQKLPWVDFGTGCYGHWIRCTYTEPEHRSNLYLYSPAITRLGVRSIGGMVSATECIRLKDEQLGVSNGKPGQTFQLQGCPVLSRQPGEHLRLRLPNGDVEDWEEVTDFGGSGASDRHYLIDSQAGTVQFGPLVREPSQIKAMTQQRSQLQSWGKQTPHLDALLPIADDHSPDQKRQYGKVPPLGAEIYMSAYRVGGGSRGNVQAGTLSVMKVAIPYIQRVVNYSPATGGQEAESLDEAVLRVPQILRTSQTAVIPEDFENIVLRAHPSVYRAHCLPKADTPGVVKVLIVPRPDGVNRIQPVSLGRDFPDGMDPDRYFALESIAPKTLEHIQAAIDHHRALGLQVRLESPTYVGVQVAAEILLQPQYDTATMREVVRQRLVANLYHFINPITGSFGGRGWPLGQPLHRSDIVALLQDLPEVSYVGKVDLFGIRKHGERGWQRSGLPDSMVDPGELGLLCSWHNPALLSGHSIQFESRDR